MTNVAPAQVRVHLEAGERSAGTIYVQSSFLKPVLGGRSYFYMTRASSPRQVTSSVERVNALACPNDFLRLRFSEAPRPGFC